MSKSWAPAPPGQPVHSTKIRVTGAAPGSSEHNAVLEQHRSHIEQFIRAQHHRARLSELPQHKASMTLDGVQLTYHNNHGQDTLIVDVTPEIVRVPGQQDRYPPIQDLELGGYIFFDIGRTSGDPYPVSFSVQLNGVELFNFTFTQQFDNTFWGAVTFGKHALHYHSYNDLVNEVTQQFIPFPSPRYKDVNYVDYIYDPANGLDGSQLSPILKPYYKIFSIGSGELNIKNMTWWDGAMTPEITETSGGISSHWYGGGVKAFDAISSSPLIASGKNKLQIITSSNGQLSGTVFAEFFSRSSRFVTQSWRDSAKEGQKLRINDQPVYLSAAFTNEAVLGRSASGYTGLAQWYQAFSTLAAMLAQPTPSTPTLNVDDPTSPITTLIIDLSK